MPSCTLTGKTYVHIIHSGNQEQIKKVKFVNASADFLLHYLVLTMFEKKNLPSMRLPLHVMMLSMRAGRCFIIKMLCCA